MPTPEYLLPETPKVPFTVRVTLDERHRLRDLTKEYIQLTQAAMRLIQATPDEEAQYRDDIAALEKLLVAIEGDD